MQAASREGAGVREIMTAVRTSGGEKKLKKDSHCSVLVMGLAFLAPLRGFFFITFAK
jgi:hypothetical protein